MANVADMDKIDEVLLADGWHIVNEHSFSVDVFEYTWKAEEQKNTIFWGADDGKDTIGFEFTELVSETAEGGNNEKNVLRGKLSDIKALKFYK